MMNIVENGKITSIVLKDGEQIKVMTGKGNSCIVIKCNDNKMYIENVSSHENVTKQKNEKI